MKAQQIIFENLVTNYVVFELYIRDLCSKVKVCTKEEKQSYQNEINALKELQSSHRNLIFKTLDRIYVDGNTIIVKNERMESTMAAYFYQMGKIFPVINMGKSKLSLIFRLAVKEEDIVMLAPIAEKYF